jgi:hypothetical protein
MVPAGETTRMTGLISSLEYQSRVESAIGVIPLAINCRVEEMTEDARVFVDTGAEWSIIAGDVALEAGLDIMGPGLGRTRIVTRLGTFDGHFERASLFLSADNGVILDVVVTWLIVPDWYGPITLGWTGGLDRFRWGIDPVEERFHFGRLVDE